ncbi:MAG: hypothetical protein QW706_09445 [Candidatus Nezhaarchaeales archaeon]
MLIPREPDPEAIAVHLSPEQARKIARFGLPSARHEAVEKARELKALIAVLYPGDV